MYERFTDRARKVMQLANQEAQRFNHEYIRTEHVLLGLIEEGSGVAAAVLKNLDVDLRKIRLEVEKLIGKRHDTVAMGTLSQTRWAKRAIQYSMDEARILDHNHVGTEHILLGLLRVDGGDAAQVMMNLGLKLEEVREEVLNLLGLSAEGEGPQPDDNTVQYDTGAVRGTDADGTRYDLISPIGLEEVARTCAEGAAKYAEFNWEQGMPVADLLNHAIRHLYQFLAGDRSEPHLPHAAWNVLAAIHSDKLWPELNEGKLRGPECTPPESADPRPSAPPEESR